MWKYHPKHVEQFPDINKLCNVACCWIYEYIGILLRVHYILHISRIRINRTTLQVFVTYLTGALYVHPLWFYKHQHDSLVRSKLFVACERWWFQWRFAAILVNCAPSGEMHNYCTPHIIKENSENFLIHRCNCILLSQVYCVWQVVKTPTIILITLYFLFRPHSFISNRSCFLTL